MLSIPSWHKYAWLYIFDKDSVRIIISRHGPVKMFGLWSKISLIKHSWLKSTFGFFQYLYCASFSCKVLNDTKAHNWWYGKVACHLRCKHQNSGYLSAKSFAVNFYEHNMLHIIISMILIMLCVKKELFNIASRIECRHEINCDSNIWEHLLTTTLFGNNILNINELQERKQEEYNRFQKWRNYATTRINTLHLKILECSLCAHRNIPSGYFCHWILGKKCLAREEGLSGT